MVVAITGGIGSGKSTVVKLFSKFQNIAVYIADIEAKKLMNTSDEIRKQLIQVFSPRVYSSGQLNRPFLANIVFEDSEKLARLNQIVHPLVQKHFQDFIKKHSDKDYILYENAILFENGRESVFDRVICVTAPTNLKIQRLLDRDSITEKEIKLRMSKQWTDEKKIMQSNYVIRNISLEDTQKAVAEIHQRLLWAQQS